MKKDEIRVVDLLEMAFEENVEISAEEIVGE